MGRGVIEPERPVKVTDLLIRQKAEAMILWASHRLLTRTSVIRIRRNLTRLADYYRQGLVSLTRVQQGVTSWIAHAQHAQTWGLRRTLLGELAFTRETRHAV